MNKFTRVLAALLSLAFAIRAESGAVAREMQLTIYDDGKSCPGNCDAHVVLNPADNGTRFAFATGSSREQPKPCQVGQTCQICFGESAATCMAVLYRGAGPAAGRFDFTPAFYEATCGQANIPAALSNQCRSLDKAVQSAGLNDRINCLSTPDDTRCKATIEAAKSKQEADSAKRDQCLQMGEDTFNKAQKNPRDRRTNNCNYSEQRLGGPNSKGETWRRLLPAACRPGSYVGRDGTDCCSADLRFAASVGSECSAFFPRP